MDFLRVSGSKKVAVAIAVEFINEDNCPGIKVGGVLNVVRYEVELLCPATTIPEKITVDLEGLKIDDSVHISTIDLPDGVPQPLPIVTSPLRPLPHPAAALRMKMMRKMEKMKVKRL